jgi:DNA-binding LacI/PurR family transcriptional regulator
MTSRSMPTMKDVAKLAGVSIQTVSAVINGKLGITVETSERVRDAIQQLGYRPYSVARSLRTGQTHTLALIVTDINNPSFSTMAIAAEDIAHSFGYNLVLYNTHDDPEREASYVQSVSERWMDGVIFVATGDRMTSLDFLNAANIPTVAIDRIPMGYTGPSVTMDNYKVGCMAAEHLLSLGHRSIVHIGGPSRLLLARDRTAGFMDVLKKSGVEPGCCVFPEGNWRCESGHLAMQEILKSHSLPTAVFAANDRMAIGAMAAISEAGLQVPGDISVIGVDDIEVSAYQVPALTTIRQSFPDMASRCVHLLIDILERKEPEQTRIVMEPSFVQRKSTAPPSER